MLIFIALGFNQGKYLVNNFLKMQSAEADRYEMEDGCSDVL